MKQNRLHTGLRTLVVFLAFIPCMVWAEAGNVIFVSGDVQLSNGSKVEKGTVVSQGDEIVTGENGRVQLLMKDGDRIAIRPNSRFLIEIYKEDDSQGVVQRSPIEGKRVYNLLKGGFRTLTDKKWAKDQDSYQVKTPVATIGIRGTDYEALLQELANSLSGVSLYLGVHDGAIWVRNKSGTTYVYDDEYLYIESENDPGLKLLAPPDNFSEGETPPPGFWLGAKQAGLSDDDGEYESRRSPVGSPNQQIDPDPPIEPEIPILSFNSAGDLVSLTEGVLPLLRYNAFASGPLGGVGGFNGTGVNAVESLGLDASGDLTSFPGLYPSDNGSTLGIYQQGSSNIVNQGFDPTSGLRWGRWAGGQAAVTHGNGTENIDLTNQSLHWIVSSESVAPTVLPISGTYQYRLLGNTDPTDNFGNVGFMDGSSHIRADFTNQQISTQVGVGINGQRWTASDSDGSFGQNGTFAGQFDSVQVNGGQCGNGCSGSGGYSGFFTGGDGNGPPPGAGMGYNMDQGGTSVSGAAAFGDPQDTNAQ